MNKAGLLPLVASSFALACAAAEEPARKLSEHLTREIRATLPAYAPPPASPVSTNPPPQPSDPDTLVLPNVVVKEKHQPRLEPDDLLTTKELNKKFARSYKNSLVGLDAVLNGFSIPFVSPSLAARGRAARDYRRLEDFDHFVESTKAADPKISAGLKKAVLDMIRADEWQNRPAGGK
jgi:hypothetical protein